MPRTRTPNTTSGWPIVTTSNGTLRPEGGVNFDGIRVEGGTTVLTDPKDWAKFVLPERTFWIDAINAEAARQVRTLESIGASDVLVEWRASTQEAADALQATLDALGLGGRISVVFSPKKGP